MRESERERERGEMEGRRERERERESGGGSMIASCVAKILTVCCSSYQAFVDQSWFVCLVPQRPERGGRERVRE